MESIVTTPVVCQTLNINIDPVRQQLNIDIGFLLKKKKHANINIGFLGNHTNIDIEM